MQRRSATARRTRGPSSSQTTFIVIRGLSASGNASREVRSGGALAHPSPGLLQDTRVATCTVPRDTQGLDHCLLGDVPALLLLFIYVTLEVRHWFQGATLQWSFLSDAESYAVSAAWLVLALALLASGILTASRQLRYASLAVLLIAVAKVFLGDMAELGGLYRVAAFLGLGLSLVGIGSIYQRFVFAETAGIAAEDTQPPDGD